MSKIEKTDHPTINDMISLPELVGANLFRIELGDEQISLLTNKVRLKIVKEKLRLQIFETINRDTFNYLREYTERDITIIYYDRLGVEWMRNVVKGCRMIEATQKLNGGESSAMTYQVDFSFKKLLCTRR